MPAAAQRQANQAAAVIAALNAQPGDTAAQQVIADAVARGDGSHAPRQAPAAPASTPATPPTAQPASASSPPPPPAAAAAAPPQLSAEERARIAEARYDSLRGKYNAETQALRNQVEENSMLVRDLISRAVQPPQPAQVPASQSPEDYLKSLGATDGDIKDYGELLPILVRLAKNMYQPTISKLEGELAQLRNSAVQTQTATVEERKQRIWDELSRAVPQWSAINESDHFLDWLGIVDIFSGVTRHVALASAFKNLDRARVVAIFEAYAREYPELARAPGAPVVDPATLLAPETRGAQPPAAPEGSGSKKIWTESEIRTFYTRVRKKLVTKEEYQSFQDEIARATAEGRVRPDRVDHHANR
jgi:hypothetical protein